MRPQPKAGRPRAVSREILEEAAVELFLEQGYGATSVADITRRAGVSRATFFNYLPSKSDLLWTSIDDALEALGRELTERANLPAGGAPGPVPAGGAPGPVPVGNISGPDAGGETAAALLRLAERLEPGTIVLAFANAEPMGVIEELEESAGVRQRRAARIIGSYLRRSGADELRSEVVGAAQAGALLAALRAWSRGAPGRTSFPKILERALGMIG